MRLFRILTFKELKGYFLTPFGWIVLAFVAVMQGVSLSTAMKGFRDTPVRDSLVYVTFHTPLFWFYFLFIFPLITMRLFAEEERSGTLETLLTAPVRTWQVVFSALTSSQILAGILTIGLLVIQYFLGFVTIIWGESFAGAAFFHYISSQQHLHYFASGLFDTRPVVYFLSVAVFTLFLTYHVVDYRRWRR